MIALLEQGREVDLASARQELPKCPGIAVLRDAGEIVAMCALKRVRSSYVASISKKSGYALTDAPEVGYVVTDCRWQGRGCGRTVCTAMLQQAEGPLFATVREGNEGMIRILQANGFHQKGRCWPSDLRLGMSIGLWIR